MFAFKDLKDGVPSTEIQNILTELDTAMGAEGEIEKIRAESAKSRASRTPWTQLLRL